MGVVWFFDLWVFFCGFAVFAVCSPGSKQTLQRPVESEYVINCAVEMGESGGIGFACASGAVG